MNLTIDAEKIAKLRIIVARCGEMDRLKWWNTKGMLSNVGEMAISRGLPKTHVFARCRATFAVASARCDEVFNPPESFTLWRLPVEVEDHIEDTWARWLETPAPWKDFLAEVDKASAKGLKDTFESFGLLPEPVDEKVEKLRRADDLRSVPIKIEGESIEEAICLLATAYCSSEPGKLAVPFIREEDFPR